MLNTAPIGATAPVSDLERAKKFYGETLGLTMAGDMGEMGAMFQGGEGTMIFVYPSAGAGKATHTIAGFKVDDLEGMVKALEAKGVQFEDYSSGPIKTDERHIAKFGDLASAWFRDSEGNILALNKM